MESPSSAPPVDCVKEMIGELSRTRFYGSLEIKFEAGNVVILRKNETIKPGEITRPGTGGQNARRATSAL